MKKIWKSLCACGMVLACGVGVAGCGKDKTPVSVDLDGDGVISSWETLYGAETSTTDTNNVVGEIVYIKDANALLDINNHTDTRQAYVLSRNIDLGGKEVCINLGKSSLYGFNNVISNFKLGTKPLATNSEGDEVSSSDEVKCLFYGGTGVYGVRLFMGVQDVTASDATKSNYYISPFFNVSVLDTIAVKGRLNINGKKVDGRITASVYASMLYNGKAEAMDSYLGASTFAVSVRNVNVDGKVVVADEDDSATAITFGGIAGEISKNSNIYNAYANVDISGECHDDMVVGAIVGNNSGFVSTCVSTGSISLSAGQSIYAGQTVGGIAGVNGLLAEVKNCSTNCNITFTGDDEMKVGTQDNFVYGGIVGKNDGGVVEYAQNDAKIKLSNLHKATAGAICGTSTNGIISYVICRGSIDCTNIKNVDVAQVSGKTTKGLLEKIVITTAITINNQEIESNVNAGMVTIFETSMGEGATEQNLLSSPYFKRIYVDGVTTINIRKQDSSRLNCKLGLRNEMLIPDGEHVETDEEGNDTVVTDYVSKIPDVYQNLYYSKLGCKLYVYQYEGEARTDNSPIVSYAKNKKNESYVTNKDITPRNMMDYLDFKNHLNHNEVSYGSTVVLNELHFTLGKEQQELSYFGESEYNGEMAYFDREFSQSYAHNPGKCENNDKDEMLSFLYDTITTGNEGESLAIKVNKEYMGIDFDNINSEEYAEDKDGAASEGVSLLVYRFMKSVSSVFECLNATYSIRKLNFDKVNIIDASGDSIVKYLEYSVFDGKDSYKILFDVSSMISDNNNDNPEDKDSFIVYLII